MSAVDPFALLGLPRRPWLDPEQVKAAFHDLSREHHPDAAIGVPNAGSGSSFAALNEAHATLSDPRRRLGILLALEFADGFPAALAASASAPAPVPAGLADQVFPTQGFLQTLDRFLARKTKAAAAGALARALLAREEFALREETETKLAELDVLHEAALAELRAFDAERWDARPADAVATLRGLRDRLSYLGRWTEQFRERLFQLGL